MSDRKTVAIIPVRGGSRGIPRKNARLLAGKPLLAYSIAAAQAAGSVDLVYVSTDDAELAEIARRYGCLVLTRSDELADDKTGLDEVMIGAVGQIEQTGVLVERIVTIQATCPLISARTIDLACAKQIEDELDTVVTVVDETHLAWGCGDGGEFAPLYEARVNRQLLPRHYRETGGVVACSMETLKNGSRFGARVGVIEVGKTEAIDIDDYFDWWMAEKSLLRKRICFHVIGNSSSGLGHVYRALTLADRLIDHDLWFLVSSDSAMAADIIKRRFYTVRIVPPGREAQAIIEDAPDLVINDVLDTNEEFMSTIKNAEPAVINFEDIGAGGLLADYLINAMYDSHPRGKGDKILHGHEYCCLRDEFYSIEADETVRKVKNVLILFGGTDCGNVTTKCLRWIDSAAGDWKITVIVGIGNKNLDEIKTIAAGAKHHTEVIYDTSVISYHMARADVAVTSAGRTVFELAAMAVPMMVVSQNDRETHHVFACTSPGVIYCGRASELSEEAFVEAFGQLAGDEQRRKKMKEILLDANLRQGVTNVLEIIEDTLKKVHRI